jgi:hypothetical protein
MLQQCVHPARVATAAGTSVALSISGPDDHQDQAALISRLETVVATDRQLFLIYLFCKYFRTRILCQYASKQIMRLRN